jgi:hypothetical protein
MGKSPLGRGTGRAFQLREVLGGKLPPGKLATIPDVPRGKMKSAWSVGYRTDVAMSVFVSFYYRRPVPQAFNRRL